MMLLIKKDEIAMLCPREQASKDGSLGALVYVVENETIMHQRDGLIIPWFILGLMHCACSGSPSNPT